MTGIGRGIASLKVRSHRNLGARDDDKEDTKGGSSAQQRALNSLQTYEAASARKLFSSRSNATMLRYG